MVLDVKKFFRSFQNFLKLLETLTVLYFVHDSSLKLSYSLRKLFEKFLNYLSEFLFDKLWVDLIEFADAKLIFCECILKLKIEFLANKGNKLDFLKLVLIDALVTNDRITLLYISDVNLSMFGASFFISGSDWLLSLLLLSLELLLILHLLHEEVVLTLVALLTVCGHTTKWRVLVMLVAQIL